MKFAIRIQNYASMHDKIGRTGQACNVLPNSLRKMNVFRVTDSLKTMAKQPNVVAAVTKTYFTSRLANIFKSMRDCITFCQGQKKTLKESQSALKQFKQDFGSDQFEWRLSPKEIGNIFNVIVMRKFEPLRHILNKNILRITEGDLLHPAQPINLIGENLNPHKYEQHLSLRMCPVFNAYSFAKG